MILTLLVSLLGTFLSWLLSKWLNSGTATYEARGRGFMGPAPTDLVNSKTEFLKMISWRIWLGPNRITKAAQLYDKAVARYAAPHLNDGPGSLKVLLNDASKSKDYSLVVKNLTEGLTLDA